MTFDPRLQELLDHHEVRKLLTQCRHARDCGGEAHARPSGSCALPSKSDCFALEVEQVATVGRLQFLDDIEKLQRRSFGVE